LINRYEHIELSLGESEQFSILNTGPSGLRNPDDLMVFNLFGQSTVDTLVEQKLHEATASILALASSKKAMICSRETVGNPSRNSSIDCPPSKYSMSVCTGTLVPLNTGVPPKMSGVDVMSGGLAGAILSPHDS
jgi:hypothetical protein